MFKFLMKKNNEKGFTLVELMVVIAIIGILVAIAVPIYKNSLDTARENTCLANLRIIDGAISVYTTDKGNPPTVVKDLVDGGYLQSEPKCPGGGDYTIENDMAKCSIHGTLADTGTGTDNGTGTGTGTNSN